MKTKISILICLILTCLNINAQTFDLTDSLSNITIISDNDSVRPISVLMPNISNIKTEAKGRTAVVMSSSYELSHIPETQNIATDKAVGDIPISKQSSNSGAVIYNVAIEAPIKGRNGLQPGIKLTYNSQSGGGIAGFGWNIAGLSSISLTNSNFYYNNKTEAVKLDKTCPITIDGTRLIVTSETDTQKTYEPETGNMKVIAHLNGNAIKYFTVYLSNGSIATYGYSGNIRTQLTYPLTRLTDQLGNYMDFIYSWVSGLYYIGKIEYGGSLKTGHYASIQFNYTDREDVTSGFVTGQEIKMAKLLSSIVTYSGYSSSIIRTYTLSYKRDKVSFLNQIDCKVINSSLNPLKFYYGYDNTQPAQLSKTEATLLSYFSDPDLVVNKGKFEWGSEDDGLIVYPRKNLIMYEKSGSLISHSRRWYKSGINPDQELLVYTDLKNFILQPYRIKAGEGFMEMFSANVDNEPGDEIVKITSSEYYGNEQVTFETYKPVAILGGLAKYSSKRFVLPSAAWYDERSLWPKLYLPGDYDGDGKMEIFAVSMFAPMGNENQNSNCFLFDLKNETKLFEKFVFNHEPGKSIVFAFDFDGDGKTDICHINGNGTDVYSFSTEGRYSLNKIASYSGLRYYDVQNKKFVLGDINGDGKNDIVISPAVSKWDWKEEEYPCPEEAAPGTDFCFRRVWAWIDMGNIWKVFLSTGATFTSSTLNITDMRSEDKYIMQDVDKNGLSDLVKIDQYGNMTMYLNENGKLGAKVTSGISVPSSTVLISSSVAQYNYHNFLIGINNGTLFKFSCNRDEGKESLLTGAVNSMGVVDKNYYNRINNPYTYGYLHIKGSGAVFPYENIIGPIWVLEKSESFCKTKISSMNFKYNNAVLHRQGLGFIGFEKISSTDNLTGHIYEQQIDPMRMGVPIKSVSPTQETTNTWAVSVAANKKATIRLNETTNKNKLSGNIVTTKYTYDSYGNNILTEIDYGLGTKTVTGTTYANKDSSTEYVIGLPLTITNVEGRLGGADFTTGVGIEYNTLNIPVTKKTYTNGLKTSESCWTYDAVGNVITESVAAYNTTDFLTTTYAYNANLSLIAKITDPMGLSTSYSDFDTYGNPRSVTDYKNNVTKYTFDDLSRTIKIENPFTAGETQLIEGFVYGWHVEGQMLYFKYKYATNQPPQSVNYDAFGRELRKSNRSFSEVIHEDKVYDNRGRLIKVSDPMLGAVPTRFTVNSYDNYDRITQSVTPSGKTVKYSYNGNEVTTDNAGVVTKTTYDASGAVIKVTDAAGDISYTLRPDRQPSSVKAPNGSETKFEYDNYGRKTKITDPSAGTISYAYDAWGNMNKQTDARNKVITYTYNKFGQPLTEVAPEITTTYTYHPTEKQLLTSVSAGGTSINYTYDNLLRIKTKSETVAGINLSETYTYNAGEVNKITYSNISGEPLEYVKNSNGYEQYLKLGPKIIRQIYAMDNFGHVTSRALGNGTSQLNSYSTDGLPTQVNFTKGGISFLSMGYSFDAQKGVLNWRKDNTRNITETFGYDNLQRLTHIGGTAKVAYNHMGNITSKADAGTLQYNTPNKPYAVSKQIGNPGGVPMRNQDVTYSSFQRPLTIVENNNKADITYGPGYARNKMTFSQNSNIQYTRYYIGNNYEKDIAANGTTTERLYIGGTAYNAPAVYTKTGNGAWVLQYIYRDYLGSILAIADDKGNKLAEYSYDAWGRMRNPANQVAYMPDQAPTLLLGRGYTGHEHLPMFGLVNMNARLYDPVLGRFLSPDPYVQAPSFSQNFNRYSYCVNNPLIYRDPSGELFLGTILSGIKDFVVNTFGRVWDEGFNAWSNKDNWHNTTMAWKIDVGMFRGNFLEILSRFTWESPQSHLGNIINGFYAFGGGVKDVNYYEGATVIQGYKTGGSGFTLGNYITGDREIEADPNNTIFQHEFGHYLQSRAFGLLYTNFVILPSLESTFKSEPNMSAVEQDANIRALKYFRKKDENYNGWNFSKLNGGNHIIGYNSALSFYSEINQNALKSWHFMLFVTQSIYGERVSGVMPE